MISRAQKELTDEDIAEIATTYHTWRTVGEGSSRSLCDEQELDTPSTYADIPGYCKSTPTHTFAYDYRSRRYYRETPG